MLTPQRLQFYKAKLIMTETPWGKVQKILPFFEMSENTAQSFIMGVYEKFFFLVFEVSGTNWLLYQVLVVYYFFS